MPAGKHFFVDSFLYLGVLIISLLERNWWGARMIVPILFRHSEDSYILFSVEKLKYVVDG